MGHIELLNGNRDEALRNFKNGIELRYDNARIYYEAGTCARMKTNYSESKLYYQRAIEKFENSDLTNSEREDIKANFKLVNQYEIERKRENIIPQITIKYPFTNKKDVLSWTNGAVRKDKFVIEDQSPIQKVEVNGLSKAVDSTINNPVLTHDFKLTDTEGIFVFSDIYGNVNDVVFDLQTTDSVKIELHSPPQNMNNELVTEFPFSDSIMVSGQILTNIPHVAIYANGTRCLVDSLIPNPDFKIVIPYNAILDSVKIEVVDHLGFTSSFLFKINHKEALRVAANQMGKTWFVFIENSEYEIESSLQGPSKDFTLITEVLKDYKIDYVWHKKNLSKQQFEQFMVEELASKIKTNKVNSLILWYAGHGHYDGYSSYWIPVDGEKSKLSSLYPIDHLKTPLQRMNLNHLLVITDACQAGASVRNVRSGAEELKCDDINFKIKSAQILTSSALENADDKSDFASYFANLLRANSLYCIPIDRIAAKLKERFKNSLQEPKFGTIDFLEELDGTFFFLKN
ncbi:MAG: caspase family protein [Bacteroidetes bacterium]|nr:caspase family protein [Bacteroidota bacterium]